MVSPRNDQLKGIDRNQKSFNFIRKYIYVSLNFVDNKEIKERDITGSILREFF